MVRKICIVNQYSSFSSNKLCLIFNQILFAITAVATPKSCPVLVFGKGARTRKPVRYFVRILKTIMFTVAILF